VAGIGARGDPVLAAAMGLHIFIDMEHGVLGGCMPTNLRRLLDPGLGICDLLLSWERAYALNRRLAHDLFGRRGAL
jgi:hypothetical protein